MEAIAAKDTQESDRRWAGLLQTVESDVQVVEKFLFGRKSLLVHEILSLIRISQQHKYYCDTTSTNSQTKI